MSENEKSKIPKIFDTPTYQISDKRFDEIFEDLRIFDSNMEELRKVIDENNKERILQYMKNRLDLYQTRIIMSKINMTTFLHQYQDEIFDVKTERNIFKTVSIIEGIILLILFAGYIF